MVFSSNLFLYAFLPPVLLTYYLLHCLTPKTSFASNLLLLTSSVALYFWSNGSALVALLGTTLLTHSLALSIEQQSAALRKPLLTTGIAINLAVLFYFKYYDFFRDNFIPRRAATYLVSSDHAAAATLPVGISFYTFMAISYLVEVYKGAIKPSGFMKFFTYLTMFPHLIAGPIVRYSEIEKDMNSRRISIDMLFEGFCRFAVGLGKKTIIANPLGEAADRIFSLSPDHLSSELSWVGALAYAFQIYFDFSGYTDMAIGLALMLGFRFPENFNNPYRSSSITEFWRRWHMTLTRWFKDYLYIPLGGNRRGFARTLLNLFFVFLLCGLWHGAAWTFVIWGVYHGALLVCERLLAEYTGLRQSGILGAAITFLLVIVGWVFFRCETITSALSFLEAMFFLKSGAPEQAFAFYASTSTLFYIVLAALISFLPIELVFNRAEGRTITLLRGATGITLVGLSLVAISDASYAPFIYFRF